MYSIKQSDLSCRLCLSQLGVSGFKTGKRTTHFLTLGLRHVTWITKPMAMLLGPDEKVGCMEIY